MNPRDIDITREDVVEWLSEFKQKPTEANLREYLTAKLADGGQDEVMVNTQEHDSLEDETSLVDMILMDLPSYGITLAT
jgi:hypothetical protein